MEFPFRKQTFQNLSLILQLVIDIITDLLNVLGVPYLLLLRLSKLRFLKVAHSVLHRMKSATAPWRSVFSAQYIF